MKAISLWQPWATAIVVGNKRIETRSWPTKYRGPLAIHAAKRWDKDQKEFASVEYTLRRLPKRLPFGAIVAVAMLIDVRPTFVLLGESLVSPIEKIYGDYGQGRWGWIFSEIYPLPEPIPFRGAQGLFNVPDELFPATRDR